jgi:hypothetical protein
MPEMCFDCATPYGTLDCTHSPVGVSAEASNVIQLQPKMVDLPKYLEDLSEWFSRYLYTRSPHAYDVLALWTIHTHCMSAWSSTPRLIVTSPIPGCGKTTLLEHLEHLCLNSLMGSHATPALIARVVHAKQSTVLLDETDNLLSAKKEGVGDLVAVLNSGYRRGNTRPVLVPVKGGDWEVRQMNTYSAVAMGGIGDHLPDALVSRSITIELDKALEHQVHPTDWDEIGPDAAQMKHKLASWAEHHTTDLAKTPKPEVPGLHGRDREVWLPLLTVGRLAGQEWEERALACYRWFTQDQVEAAELKPKGQKEQLLSDVMAVWKSLDEPTGFIGTEDLLMHLHLEDPSTWGEEARYGRLKAKRLANLLNNYGIRPEHNQQKTQRGYLWFDFKKQWDRYLGVTGMGVQRVQASIREGIADSTRPEQDTSMRPGLEAQDPNSPYDLDAWTAGTHGTPIPRALSTDSDSTLDYLLDPEEEDHS